MRFEIFSETRVDILFSFVSWMIKEKIYKLCGYNVDLNVIKLWYSIKIKKWNQRKNNAIMIYYNDNISVSSCRTYIYL